jgi:hypothetical protein
MDETSAKDMQKALAKRLARHSVEDEVVAKVARHVARNGLRVGRFDICPYGICIDYFGDRQISLDEFIGQDDFRSVRILCHGIPPLDDFMQITAEFEINEFVERGIVS